jgi:anhydro-N-acetylmuramic acid kinase
MNKILGVMSGTSCDGLNIVYCEIEGSYKNINVNPVFFGELPYDKEFKDYLLFLTSGKISVGDVSRANFYLGKKFGESIKDFIKRKGIDDIDLIVSHGQTVYHSTSYGDKPYDIPCTLQIGDGDIISYITGYKVLSDIRVKDMAAGGQGAPMVSYADYVIYTEDDKNTALQNIGGIGNVTYIPKNSELNSIIAFDTGPGNVLIDWCCREYFGVEYDKNGDYSKKGKINESFIKELWNLENDYFLAPPPKTTGKEIRYNSAYLNKIKEIIEYNSISRDDALRSIVRFTALTITESYKKYLKSIEKIIISGGGSENKTLVEDIKNLTENKEYYIPPKIWNVGKESIAFAIIGQEYLSMHFSNVPTATGASRSVIQGKLSLPF